jgi:hypothetical protein
MAESQSKHSRFNLFATKEKRDGVVDTTLDVFDISLKLLDATSDLLPVPGVKAVIIVLQSMVTQIRVSLKLSILCGVVADVETEYALK